MSRNRTIAAAALLTLVLAACGETAASPRDPGAAPTTQPPPTSEPAPPATAAPPSTAAPTTTTQPPTTQPPTTTTVPPTTTTTVPPTTKPPADPVPDGSGCTPGPGDLGDGRWYGLVEANDGTVLTFDLACWFTGEDAVLAAKQDGAEEPPNDYYVRNQNPATRTLQATADTEVVWYPQLGDPASETTSTFAEWDAAKDERGAMPGIWVVIEGGVVTRIQEQWVP